MLLGEELGGDHNRRLQATPLSQAGGYVGHGGLAAPDVALQKSMHRMPRGQVRRDVADHASLCAGRREGE